jgi:transcriptional regulator with XRE-family HTH domain
MVQTTVSGLPTIGDVILAWRKFRGLRSIELVKKAGIKKGYLSAVEHNKRANPQEEYLVKLADALEVPLQDIYGRRMPPEKREDGKAEEEEAKDAGRKEPGERRPTNEVTEVSGLGVGHGRGLESEPQATSTPQHSALGQLTQKASTPSARLDSPLSIPHQKILMRKLEVLERTIREIRALVGPTQDQE